MTDGCIRGKVYPGGVPFDLRLPRPSGIRVGESLTEGNIGRLAAGLARSYRDQWQSHLILPRRNHPLDRSVAQTLGDRVEQMMRGSFREQLEGAFLKRFDERLRHLEQGASTEITPQES